jgi:rhodanese-related sulfurtransferase
MKQISVDAFKQVIGTEAHNPSIDFINVCTPAEYAEKHIQGVRSVPLDEVAAHVQEFQGKQTIYVHCRSGARSRRAIETLQDLGIKAELVNVEGGLMAWDAAGFGTHSTTSRMPIMRQVLLIAGVLVLTGTVSGYAIDTRFLLVPTVVGTGLSIAGFTGWCGMTHVLAYMPWNKA